MQYNWVKSKDKKTISILDYSNGFGFRNILYIKQLLLSPELSCTIKNVPFCYLSLNKSAYFAMLMNRAYEQLTSFCDNVAAKP